MRLILIAVILVSGCCMQPNCQAQSKPANTLLWRISGNGLQQPSYLYGTMHLADRRLFFFGDSVYRSLEYAEGFAIELDPNELMDSLYTHLSESDNSPLLKDMVEAPKFKKTAKLLEKKLGIPAEKITRKKLAKYRDGAYLKHTKPDDMKTFVDLYLYDIARKLGKWTGGIEDVNDQMLIIDEMGKSIDIDELLEEDESKSKKFTEQMVGMYEAQDINAIESMVNRNEAAASALELTTRNRKMAIRMDSLANIRRSFFAVGVAHLPGKEGVIELLRSRGFIVEPVISSARIAPEKYRLASVELPWYQFNSPDSAYRIEMPGKPSDVKLMDELNTVMYTDLANSTVYMTLFTFRSSEESAADQKKRMIASFNSKGLDQMSERLVIKDGVEGTEMRLSDGSYFMRTQFFLLKDKLFMAMMAAPKKSILDSSNATRFFKSLTLNSSVEAKATQWKTYSNAELAFEIDMPGKPTVEKNDTERLNEYVNTSILKADVQNNAYYMAIVSQTQKGYMILKQAEVFEGRVDYYKSLSADVYDIKSYEFEGYPAQAFTAAMNKEGQDIITKTLIVCRGNRIYTFAAITEKNKEDFPDISRFFRSIKFKASLPADWKPQSFADVFSTWAPAPFEILAEDSTETEEMASKNELGKHNYVSFDEHSVTNYYIYPEGFSKYYWTKNDSSLMAEKYASYYSDTASEYAKSNPGNFDSLVSNKVVYNGNAIGAELIVKSGTTSNYKRIRLLRNADSVYELLLVAPYDQLTNDNANRFFESFRFNNYKAATNLFSSKTMAILEDIASPDSATKEAAQLALRDRTFSKEDLPLLHEAYLKNYPPDSNSYQSLNYHILDAISGIDKSSSAAFADSNYSSAAPSQKFGLLELMALHKDNNSYNQLKKHLLAAPPTAGNGYALAYRLKDSLALSKKLYPEITSLYNDSITGPAMMSVGLQLLDSQFISKAELTSNSEKIIQLASRQLNEIKASENNYPFFNEDVTTLLAKLNQKEANGLLFRYLSQQKGFNKAHIALLLLNNNQPLPTQVFSELANNLSTRTYWYDTLKALKKEKFFPAVHLTQAKFAASYVYSYATEDSEEGSVQVTLAGEKMGTVKGVQSRYFLFKVTEGDKADQQKWLGICGPFNVNKTKVTIPQNQQQVQIYYDDPYDPATNNRVFKAFIKSANEEEVNEEMNP